MSRLGTVVSFDEAVGLGVVEGAAGGEKYGFHCTQIAGGSRTIAAGTPVRFEVRPARKGTWEAFDVTAEVVDEASQVWAGSKP